jgi:hypothetical protein
LSDIFQAGNLRAETQNLGFNGPGWERLVSIIRGELNPQVASRRKLPEACAELGKSPRDLYRTVRSEANRSSRARAVALRAAGVPDRSGAHPRAR